MRSLGRECEMGRKEVRGDEGMSIRVCTPRMWLESMHWEAFEELHKWIHSMYNSTITSTSMDDVNNSPRSWNHSKSQYVHIHITLPNPST